MERTLLICFGFPVAVCVVHRAVVVETRGQEVRCAFLRGGGLDRNHDAGMDGEEAKLQVVFGARSSRVASGSRVCTVTRLVDPSSFWTEGADATKWQVQGCPSTSVQTLLSRPRFLHGEGSDAAQASHASLAAVARSKRNHRSAATHPSRPKLPRAPLKLRRHSEGTGSTTVYTALRTWSAQYHGHDHGHDQQRTARHPRRMTTSCPRASAALSGAKQDAVPCTSSPPCSAAPLTNERWIRLGAHVMCTCVTTA